MGKGATGRLSGEDLKLNTHPDPAVLTKPTGDRSSSSLLARGGQVT